MPSQPDYLPPRWRENMQCRRACLLRFDAERPLSTRQADALAAELAESHGEGDWDCTTVQLDGNGREWEFRFKPHVAPIRRQRWLSAPQ